ncbi:MAG: hypothetical protein M1378_12415 [Bacteroidetes bacterium]|nr:hypothetical protein [Bacteroidota bacterium]
MSVFLPHVSRRFEGRSSEDKPIQFDGSLLWHSQEILTLLVNLQPPTVSIWAKDVSRPTPLALSNPFRKNLERNTEENEAIILREDRENPVLSLVVPNILLSQLEPICTISFTFVSTFDLVGGKGLVPVVNLNRSNIHPCVTVREEGSETFFLQQLGKLHFSVETEISSHHEIVC